MRKIIKLTLAAATAIVFFQNPVNAQSGKKNVSSSQASSGTDRENANALARETNEADNLKAVRLYRDLGEQKKAEEIMNGLAKKYPNGVTARQAEMGSIFEGKPLDEKIQSYRVWLKKFPPSSFAAQDRQLYTMAAFRIGRDMIRGGRNEEAVALVRENLGTPEYYGILMAIVGDLSRPGSYHQALGLLEEAIVVMKNEQKRTMIHDIIEGQYAQALINTGSVAEGVALAEALLESAGNDAKQVDVMTLAKGYEASGRNLDALKVMEKFLINNSVNAEMVAATERLYKKLNNNKGNFSDYWSGLDTQVKDVKEAKYKAEMIEREAPPFTLFNMEGEMVSLSDYLGKIVILDFWATWCGPCVMSFPGMQAAVNKYKDDPEVEFLFINTFQREKNYKELVSNFIKERGFNFHVLYDEMVDREKEIARAYGISVIPTKVFIDRKGKIRFQSTGASTDIGVVVDEMDIKIKLMREATKD